MSKEQEPQPTNNPKDKEPPLPDTAKNNVPDTSNKQEDTEKKRKKPKKINWESYKKWWYKNWDKAFTILINAVLAYFTYTLYRVAVTQTNAAKDAVIIAREANDISKNSLEDQRDKDSVNRENDSLKFKRDSINLERGFYLDSTAISLSSASLNEQIEALTQQRRQFEIESRPYVGIIDLAVDTSGKYGNPDLSFKYVNYGKLPAKVLNTKFNLVISGNSNLDEIKKHKTKDMTKAHNSIISGDYYNPVTLYGITFNKNQYEAFINNNAYLYIFGELYYQNNYTKDMYLKKFIYSVKFRLPNGKEGIEIFQDDDIDIRHQISN